MIDFQRRRLFTRAAQIKLLRPPWSQPESQFTHDCTRCGDCIRACETEIIKAGTGGFPEIDFQRGECTFCQACVTACPTDALALSEAGPFVAQIGIDEQCLAKNGVVCRSCEDSCEPAAIGFQLQQGGISVPKIDTELCTLCGACVAPCPTQSIQISSC